MKPVLKKQILLLLLITTLISALAFGMRLHLEQRRLAAELIRLHIVANSDSEADQRTKLRLRDAVLPLVSELTGACPDAASARAALEAGLPALRAAAEAALGSAAAGPDVSARTGRGAASASGCGSIPIAVSLTEELFPRRIYDSFSLPAGRYTALRITLGAGEGRNWWCVAFPALCLPAAAEDFETAALDAGLDRGQIRLLTSDEEPVRIKFRILDWLEAIFG